MGQLSPRCRRPAQQGRPENPAGAVENNSGCGRAQHAQRPPELCLVVVQRRREIELVAFFIQQEGRLIDCHVTGEVHTQVLGQRCLPSPMRSGYPNPHPYLSPHSHTGQQAWHRCRADPMASAGRTPTDTPGAVAVLTADDSPVGVARGLRFESGHCGTVRRGNGRVVVISASSVTARLGPRAQDQRQAGRRAASLATPGGTAVDVICPGGYLVLRHRCRRRPGAAGLTYSLWLKIANLGAPGRPGGADRPKGSHQGRPGTDPGMQSRDQ